MVSLLSCQALKCWTRSVFIKSITTPKRGGMMLTLKGSSKKLLTAKPQRSQSFWSFFFAFRWDAEKQKDTNLRDIDVVVLKLSIMHCLLVPTLAGLNTFPLPSSLPRLIHAQWNVVVSIISSGWKLFNRGQRQWKNNCSLRPLLALLNSQTI